jgi:hypothetical protein
MAAPGQVPGLPAGDPQIQPAALPVPRNIFPFVKKVALYALALVAAIGCAYYGVKFGLVVLRTGYKFTVYTINALYLFFKYTLATTWLYIKWQWNLFSSQALCILYAIPMYGLGMLARAAYLEAEGIRD